MCNNACSNMNTTKFRADGIFSASDDGDDRCYIERLDENGDGTEEYINVGKYLHYCEQRDAVRLVLQVDNLKLLLPGNVDNDVAFGIAEILRRSEEQEVSYNYTDNTTEHKVGEFSGNINVSLLNEITAVTQSKERKNREKGGITQGYL